MVPVVGSHGSNLHLELALHGNIHLHAHSCTLIWTGGHLLCGTCLRSVFMPMGQAAAVMQEQVELDSLYHQWTDFEQHTDLA